LLLSIMSDQKAAVIPAKGAQLEVRTIEKYTPKKGEVLIKNHYAATNPVDFKIQQYGVFINNYPNILTSDVSGEIEAVGEGVTAFQKGDKVWAYLPLLPGTDPRNGGFQQFSIAPEYAAHKVPSNISLAEAATLGLASTTAGVGLFLDLKVPIPTEPETHRDEIIFVWGGSSAVGAFAVQFAALAGFKVIATTSPKNFDYVKKLGASQVFDYNDPEVVSKIKKEGGGRIKYAYDAIAEHGSTQKCVDILGGQGKVLVVLHPPKDLKHDGVEVLPTFCAIIYKPEHEEIRNWFNKFFNDNVAKGKIRPTSPQIVAEGIENAQKVLDFHAKGVSGTKPVLKIL